MTVKRFLASSLLSVAVLFSMASTATAATLNVVGGQLLGATGVIVDGSSYNVEFLDGTCIALYGGCIELSDFTFQSQTAAGLASQALLDQVFSDGVNLFDTDPELTTGCESLSLCQVTTPYGPSIGVVLVAIVRNEAIPGVDDAVQFGNVRIYEDLGFWDVAAFAVWTPVPEPGTAVLMGLGLAGLALRRAYPASSRSRTPVAINTSSGGVKNLKPHPVREGEVINREGRQIWSPPPPMVAFPGLEWD